jgi:hypothetical protein
MMHFFICFLCLFFQLTTSSKLTSPPPSLIVIQHDGNWTSNTYPVYHVTNTLAIVTVTPELITTLETNFTNFVQALPEFITAALSNVTNILEIYQCPDGRLTIVACTQQQFEQANFVLAVFGILGFVVVLAWLSSRACCKEPEIYKRQRGEQQERTLITQTEEELVFTLPPPPPKQTT